MALSDRTIQGAKPKTLKNHDGSTRLADDWLSDGGARGAGRLYLRVQPSGRKSFFFRCVGPSGERQALPLGEYKQSGARGLTLTAARDAANALTALLRSGVTDLRAHLEAEQRERERELEAADEADRQAKANATRGTLRVLIAGYISGLERAGKIDWKDANSVLRLHVIEPFPDLVDRKAAEIKPADLRPVLARLVDAKKGRTAGKARSYLHAAYAAAIRADFDPDAPAALCGFEIESNPVAVMPSMAHHNRAGQRVLSELELRAYMAKLPEQTIMTRLALELDLMLGGQRPTQLLRVKAADVDVTSNPGEIVLLDPKGARRQARVHVLPLVGRARELVTEALALNPTGPLFSNGADEYGKPIALRMDTLSSAVTQMSRAMVKAGEARSPFSMRDIRRTCETQLAAIGVSKDIRGQLLSHGLGGVQDRNYDRHGYWTEKVMALRGWERRLKAVATGKATTVTPIKRAATA